MAGIAQGKSLIALFEDFISDSARGRRRQAGGTPLGAGSIANYKVTLRKLKDYQDKAGCIPPLHDLHRGSLRPAEQALYRAGFKHPGHTEYLAELAADGGKPPRPVMMLVGGGLRVALVTIHRPLPTVTATITADLITEIGAIVASAMKRDFGMAAPRIGLCGINPHAGEDGEIGREEIEIVNPAAARLRSLGLDVSDARPGDTIFHEMLAVVSTPSSPCIMIRA